MKKLRHSLLFLLVLIASMTRAAEATIFDDLASFFLGVLCTVTFGLICFPSTSLTSPCAGEGQLGLCENAVISFGNEASWCFEQVGSTCAQGGLYVLGAAQLSCSPCIETSIIITNVNSATCRVTAKYFQRIFYEDNPLGTTETNVDWTGLAYRAGDEVVLCEMEGPGPSEEYNVCALRSNIQRFPSMFLHKPFGSESLRSSKFETDVAQVCAAFE